MKSQAIGRESRRAPKSSLLARRLIRAALKRHKTQARAARALGLPSQAQLSRMLAGTLRDTPAMKVALTRADARAKRAWAMVKAEPVGVDVEQAQVTIAEIERHLAALKSLVRSVPTLENKA